MARHSEKYSREHKKSKPEAEFEDNCWRQLVIDLQMRTNDLSKRWRPPALISSPSSSQLLDWMDKWQGQATSEDAFLYLGLGLSFDSFRRFVAARIRSGVVDVNSENLLCYFFLDVFSSGWCNGLRFFCDLSIVPWIFNSFMRYSSRLPTRSVAL